MPLCGCMHTSFALTPGHVESRGYGSQWEVFADQIQPLARRMPWMTVGGNHERDWPDSGDRYGSIFDSGELGSCHTQFFIGTLFDMAAPKVHWRPAVCSHPSRAVHGAQESISYPSEGLQI